MLILQYSLQVLGRSDGVKMIKIHLIKKKNKQKKYPKLRQFIVDREIKYCVGNQSTHLFDGLLLPNSQFSPMKYLGQMQRYPLTVNQFRQVAL